MSFQWHNVHTRFRENPSVGSNAKTRDKHIHTDTMAISMVYFLYFLLKKEYKRATPVTLGQPLAYIISLSTLRLQF